MKNKIIFSLILLLIITTSLFYLSAHLPYQPQNKSQEKIIVIERNEGLFQISQKLKKEDLIRDNLLFEFYVIAKNDFYNLKRGHYKLNSSMSIAEIAQKIIKGDTIKLNLTFIEGWKIEDIAQYLEDKKIVKKEKFFETTKNYEGNLSILKDKPKEQGLEGYLFPNTYTFNKQVSSTQIIDKLVFTLQKNLKEELEENFEEKNIHKILTMASLLEKEVQTYKDKRIVSGIAWKRLKEQIPLQMDATITYLTGKKSTKVATSETKIDSPYNTYKYRGLPPGPICNPGFDSIKAALNPKESNYWYYLSAPNGETIFSENFIQHKKAKQEYLK